MVTDQNKGIAASFPVRQWFCLAILGFSLALGVTAPLLSSRHVITVSIELGLYFYCMVAIVLSALFFLMFRPLAMEKTWFGHLQGLVLPLSVVFVWLVFTSCIKSNATFRRWTMRDISPNAWAGIAADVQSLGEQSLKENKNEERANLWSSNVLPASFGAVGRKEDFFAGYARRSENGTVEVKIVYGYKSRRWGLFQGPEEHLKSPYTTDIVKVGTNLFFYMGGG